MRTILHILVSCLLVLNAIGQDFWQQRDSVNGPEKAVCGSFVILERGFVVGGLDEFGFKRKMYSYNPFQDDWDDEESIGGLNGDGLERGSLTAFSIGTKGYICFGQGETVPYMDDLWEYDRATGAWSQKADFIGGARKQAVSFVINDMAYVGTGQSATGLKKDFYKYEPTTNTWTQLNDFAGTARRQAVAFSMGGYGWLGTGDDGVLKKDFWMYNPSTDTWIQKTDFPGTPRSGAVGWSTFPTAFIALGEDNNFDYKKDVWEYNYYNNAWIQRAEFPGSGRKNAIAFVLNGIAFVGTGYSGVFEDDMYAYYGIVGVEEHGAVGSSVFPNPTNENLTIEINPATGLNELEVYSVLGENVSKKIISEPSSFGVNMDVRFLESGTYWYRIRGNDGRLSSGKFIVQK
jgi:hypothetical protein